jgi:hypothetical protein
MLYGLIVAILSTEVALYLGTSPLPLHVRHAHGLGVTCSFAVKSGFSLSA